MGFGYGYLGTREFGWGDIPLLRFYEKSECRKDSVEQTENATPDPSSRN